MKERLIISLILLLMAYAVCGCEKEPEYSNDFQYSEYEWIGPFCDDFTEYICWKANIDYDGEWRISCPKCSVAYIEQKYDGGFVANFSVDAVVEPMRIACRECLYPIGRDWKIIKLPYQHIYNRALSAEKIAEIDQSIAEPNEVSNKDAQERAR